MNWESFWFWADRTSLALAYVAYAGALVVAWRFSRAKARRRRHLREIAQGRPHRAAAVVIAFGPGDAVPAVAQYLESRLEDRRFEAVRFQPGRRIDLPHASAILPIVAYHEERSLLIEELERQVEAVRQLQKQLDDEGFKEVFLFYKGPVAFAILVGTLFANWGLVHVHQFADGAYQYWLPLTDVKRAIDVVPGTLDLAAESIADIWDRTAGAGTGSPSDTTSPDGSALSDATTPPVAS